MSHDTHMLYTLSALQILALVDRLDLVTDKRKVAQYVAGLQQPDGSFAGDQWGESSSQLPVIREGQHHNKRIDGPPDLICAIVLCFTVAACVQARSTPASATVHCPLWHCWASCPPAPVSLESVSSTCRWQSTSCLAAATSTGGLARCLGPSRTRGRSSAAWGR